MTADKSPVAEDDVYDPTPDELANADFSSFDLSGIEFPQELHTSDQAFAALERAMPAERVQLSLFTPSPKVSGLPSSPAELQSLWSIVVHAYADTRASRSIDFVIAEPAANAAFVRRCWELGAAASPFALNWLLMNARKSRRLDAFHLVRSTSVGMKRDRFDQFAFAADIAMRTLQDRIYFEEQRDVSIDHVLCEPHLAREFDRLAGELAPDFGSFDFRWAAISLRKARRTRSAPEIQVDFQDFGRVEDIKRARIPQSSGIYWIQAGACSLFVGVAQSLRTQIELVVDRLGVNILPAWIPDALPEKPTIRMCSYGLRPAEMAQSSLLRRFASRLNHKQFTFFESAA